MDFEGNTHISVGPWGGQEGAKWDDGVHSSVRQVVICHGAAIHSIQIEYDKKGSSVWSDKHGGTGGLKTNKIKLEYPDEFLVSVSGYYGSIVEDGQVLVLSLAFESNRRKYGPFGIQHGTQFAFPTTSGKVVGFHGRSSWYLDSIGVYLKPLLPRNLPNSNSSIATGHSLPHNHNTDIRDKDRATGHVEEEKFNNVIYEHCTGPGRDKYKAICDFQFEKFKNVMLKPTTGNILRPPTIDPWNGVESGAWGVNNGAIFEYDVHRTNNTVYMQQVTISTNDTIDGPSTNPRNAAHFGLWDAKAEKSTHPPLLSLTSKIRPSTSVQELLVPTGILPSVVAQAKDITSTPATTPGSAVSYGPWGGSGGAVFNDGIFTGVREVHVTRYRALVSIRVCYDSNGQEIWGARHGGSEGIRLDKITFDYPSEILTHISGHYASTSARGPAVVKSLTLHTNRRKYGPFGEEQGIPFSSPSNKGRIVGFHGRKGNCIDSIGVHALEDATPPPPPIPLSSISSTPPPPIPLSSLSSTPPIPLSSMSSHPFAVSSSRSYQVPPVTQREAAPSTCGPWGGNGGKPWDDGVFGGVKSIYLTKGEFIYCIQIEYDRNSQSVWSARHGSGNGRTSHTIKLDYPNEVLTSVSGYHDSVSGDDANFVVKSLTFITTKGTYGPFGEGTGTAFSSKAQAQGKIVGFHGRSACFLNSIGVHVQPWPTDHGLGDRGEAPKTAVQKPFK